MIASYLLAKSASGWGITWNALSASGTPDFRPAA